MRVRCSKRSLSPLITVPLQSAPAHSASSPSNTFRRATVTSAPLGSPCPACVTKDPCRSLLQSCSSMTQLKQIHCRVLRSGLNGCRDVVASLLVFCVCPVSGDLQYAQKVFDACTHPSVFMYNVMIKAFAKAGDLQKAVLLFDRLREWGLSPDCFTYPFVLKAIGSLGMVLDGEKVHGFIVKTGMESDSYARKSLMDMYGMMGRAWLSRMLFNEMPEKDVVSWNILISGYVKSRMFKEAVSVFREMQQKGLKADEATLVSTLSACVHLGNLELGKEIHYFMDEEFKFSVTLGNAILDMYVKCGSVSTARQFFDRMPKKDIISWTTVVSGYANCGLLDEATLLFNGCPSKDVVLWTVLIDGYVKFNRFDDALHMFKEMQVRRIKPDKFTIVTLLKACARSGLLEKGEWIHDYIEENKMRVDAVVGTALIDMYSKCGCIERSLEIFKRVQRKDPATWTSIICGLAMHGRSDEALELFLDMKNSGVKPDELTFIGILSACSHAGLVADGRRYFSDMKNIFKVEPKLEHYSCLVDLLGRAGLLDEAENLIDNIPEDNQNGSSILPLWASLIGACKIHGNVEVGERVAKHIFELDPSNSGVHTALANMYASANRWEEVIKVRRELKGMGFKKIPGCSSIELNGGTKFTP